MAAPAHEWVWLVRPGGLTPAERTRLAHLGWWGVAWLAGAAWAAARGRWGWAAVGVAGGVATVGWFVGGALVVAGGHPTPDNGCGGTVVDLGPWRWVRSGDLVHHWSALGDAYNTGGRAALVGSARTGFPGGAWPEWWATTVGEWHHRVDPWVVASDRGGLLGWAEADGAQAAAEWGRLHPPGYPERLARWVDDPHTRELRFWAFRFTLTVVGLVWGWWT